MRWICRGKFVALLPALCYCRPHWKQTFVSTRMTRNLAAHTLLDQLLNEVKQNLVDNHIDKMKTDILNVVAKKQENFLQDMVQICDSISRDTVDAISETKRDILDPLSPKWPQRIGLHSFMKKDPKREKHDSKWPYMAPNDLIWAKNDPKWPKNDILISGGPTWDQKWSEMGKKWPKMTLYGPKWPKKDQKWLKIAQKWPKNDILISGGTSPGPKSQKNCSTLSSIFDVEAPFQRYLPKSEILAPKEVTKPSGKRSIGLPGYVFFLHVGKGSQGHVLDRSGPIWPTWNTPKKGFLSRKTPKKGVKMGWGHFHERVNRSPIRCGHFGANGSKISRFVSEIRPFKEKVLV